MFHFVRNIYYSLIIVSGPKGSLKYNLHTENVFLKVALDILAPEKYHIITSVGVIVTVLNGQFLLCLHRCVGSFSSSSVALGTLRSYQPCFIIMSKLLFVSCSCVKTPAVAVCAHVSAGGPNGVQETCVV